MRRLRLLGLVTSLVTAGVMVGAPALAAGGTPVPLTFNAAIFQMPGTSLMNGKVDPALNPCRMAGTPAAVAGTFADASVNSTGLPTGSYTPSGSPVAFTMPPASGNSAVCAGLSAPNMDTVTLTVPSGKYTDAYFLASVGNGPSLVNVTPAYGSTNGAALTTVFPDWCTASTKVAGTLPPGSTPGWAGGDRVNYDGTTTGQTGLNCGLDVVHVSGLDGSKDLTGLTLQLAAAKTAIPDASSGGKGATQNASATLNIAAVTLANSASLPKTGGNETGILIGIGLLLAGAALVIRPRLNRNAA